MFNFIEKAEKSKLFAFAIFFLISFVIVITWFDKENIFGGAEVGLFAYNPGRWFEMSKYVWWDAVAPGQLIPHFIVGVPLYFAFYLFNQLGLSAQNIQAIFFFLTLFLMGFGMYLLSLNIFESGQKKYAVLAGLFYMFNVYTLVGVWHRFLYSTMILAAVLPIIVLLWHNWITKGGILNLNLFLLANFLSVYMYGNLASVATVWILLAVVTLAEVLFPWSGKSRSGKIGVRFLVGFAGWFLINIWWIAPTFSIAPGLLPQQHSSEDNLGTLVVLGRQTIMPFLLQLANPFYLFYRQELGEIYSSIIFKTVPWIISAVIFYGLIVSLKLTPYAKYAVLFIVALLLSKGAASPFSYPIIFGFEHSYLLGVLRNPFEKIGIILPIFGAILFSIGLQAFLRWGAKYLGRSGLRAVMILIIVALLGYAYPMLGGKIFGTTQFPVKVNVPKAYQAADLWMRGQNEKGGVILHLPFAGKDVVTYLWDQGYHGVDQNEILFTSLPSLTKIIGIKRIDDTLRSLTYAFIPPASQDPNTILKLIQSLNVRFIILHKDIKWDDKDTYGELTEFLEPVAIEKTLDSLTFLKKGEDFGPLVIYKLSDENYQDTITSSAQFQVIYPGGSNAQDTLFKSLSGGDVITPVLKKIDEQILLKASQSVIWPDKIINFTESSPSATMALADESFNKLGQIRIYFFNIGYMQSEKLASDLILATQKVMKVYEDAVQNKSVSKKLQDDYEQLIKSVLERYNNNTSMRQFFDLDFSNLISLHLLLLKQLGANDLTGWIDNQLVKIEIFPKYRNQGQVFIFTVPTKGLYEIATDSQTPDIYFPQGNSPTVYINGEKSIFKEDLNFDEGSYEIVIQNATGGAVLKQRSLTNDISEGEVTSFRKESPVRYTGKINFLSPAFLLFAQAYHPGWQLTLMGAGKQEKVQDHFLSNLYGNAWWIGKLGEYDFKVEFTPQRLVEKGILVSLSTGVFLILLNIFFLLKRKMHR